jgi:hypothetical protein
MGFGMAPLSAMDMDHSSLSVDVGDFQEKSFLKSEAAGIDRCQIGIVMEGAYRR